MAIKNYRQDKNMNIPEQKKNKLTIEENAGQGFISTANDCEKNSLKNVPRGILSKAKTDIDKKHLKENLER